MFILTANDCYSMTELLSAKSEGKRKVSDVMMKM